MTLFPGVAITTGAASGIGRAIALAFATAGYQGITIADRLAEGLAQTQELIAKEAPNAAVETIVIDVAQLESVIAMAVCTVARWGRIDLTVNVAGIQGPAQRSTALTLDEFDGIQKRQLSWSMAYSKENIRINCVCPGLVEYMFSLLPVSFEEQRKFFAPAIAIAPINRMGQPSEIADVCLFLCSSKASLVQGASMVADGGYMIN
ncbi:hypothetical protein N7537_007674 [Penicillium hordei]|uniref:Uncharacterized protein n=1 Tax=Penicillium hordei TaxID=40994 RepID=A0AAD6GXQ0_9EURO|nr:uncharacterized protein N7537_007674 [Penicillium hordei]KAJ5597590.1 hypothetical protein N7537_007674 [Penicillium hordei]